MKNLVKMLITQTNEEFDNGIKEAFKKYPFEIYFSPQSGSETIKLINSVKPDIVILNMFLTQIDAIGIINLLKKKIQEKLPIFILKSCTKKHSIILEATQAGVADFIFEPVSPYDLTQKILDIISQKNFFANQIADISINTAKKDTSIEKNKTKKFSEQNLELEVTEILHQIGVPAHIKGYHYLRAAIIMSIENPNIINAVTKQLYPSVAQKFSSTSSRVERAIRHAIEVAWDRGDIDILNSYFGYTIHTSRGKPTNSEFIAMISDKLRLHIKSAS